MSDPGPLPPERIPEPGQGHLPLDPDLLAEHPSLAPLAGNGWRLDRVPSTRTGLAIAGTLLLTLLAFGPVPAAVVAVLATAGVAMGLTSVPVRIDDRVPFVHAWLRTVRIGLLAWLVTGAAILALTH